MILYNKALYIVHIDNTETNSETIEQSPLETVSFDT